MLGRDLRRGPRRGSVESRLSGLVMRRVPAGEEDRGISSGVEEEDASIVRRYTDCCEERVDKTASWEELEEVRELNNVLKWGVTLDRNPLMADPALSLLEVRSERDWDSDRLRVGTAGNSRLRGVSVGEVERDRGCEDYPALPISLRLVPIHIVVLTVIHDPTLRPPEDVESLVGTRGALLSGLCRDSDLIGSDGLVSYLRLVSTKSGGLTRAPLALVGGRGGRGGELGRGGSGR